MGSAGSILRDARHRAGLSQAAVARRAGTSQSVVSAYESGARQPSLPMLHRLVAATGFDLDVELRPSTHPVVGRLAHRVRDKREEIQRIAASHGLTNVRVFGSVARGDEHDGSDIDLLVDVAPDVGLFELGRCQAELEHLMGNAVDLVPAEDLKSGIAAEVMADARPL